MHRNGRVFSTEETSSALELLAGSPDLSGVRTPIFFTNTKSQSWFEIDEAIDLRTMWSKTRKRSGISFKRRRTDRYLVAFWKPY
jgi:hypothetical protein